MNDIEHEHISDSLKNYIKLAELIEILKELVGVEGGKKIVKCTKEIGKCSKNLVELNRDIIESRIEGGAKVSDPIVS